MAVMYHLHSSVFLSTVWGSQLVLTVVPSEDLEWGLVFSHFLQQLPAVVLIKQTGRHSTFIQRWINPHLCICGSRTVCVFIGMQQQWSSGTQRKRMYQALSYLFIVCLLLWDFVDNNEHVECHQETRQQHIHLKNIDGQIPFSCVSFRLLLWACWFTVKL